VHPGIDTCRPDVGEQTNTECEDAGSARHLAPQACRRRTVMEDSSLASLNPSGEDAPSRNLPHAAAN